MVSFHASILFKEVDEDNRILIFLGKPSVCHEAKHNLSMLSLNWLITSLPPVPLLITLRFGGAPHLS